ncbi:hypothetical protein [Actinokineospora iranica]|uniref:Uncharacterized protein n=1 Tax=Actinokineospora iranica TaxID=1271860 RepID=A0A1G6MG05_9PSEU|nr:hypothetical protein [Actinokineospora iranica]SDC53906.1 hypothetical protein SAMN05216174_102511 [Actinokineospora iranica]
MTHLTDSDLVRLAAPTAPVDPHVVECASCSLRLAAWRRIARATAAPTTAVTAPAFDTLIPRLPPQAAAPARIAAAPRRGLGRSSRLAAWIVLRQARIMPRSLAPLSLLGLVLATVIGLATQDPVLAKHYFGAVVVLVVLLGACATTTRRGDARSDLLCSLPISPATVFACRVVLVLCVDLALALSASVLVHVWGNVAPLTELVGGWLGQALLASAIAVACSVWRSPPVGAVAAATTWFVCSLTTLPGGELAERAGTAVGRVWGTTPWGLALSVVLVVAAVLRSRSLPDDSSANS